MGELKLKVCKGANMKNERAARWIYANQNFLFKISRQKFIQHLFYVFLGSRDLRGAGFSEGNLLETELK